MDKFIFGSRNFYSGRSIGQGRGRGNRPRGVWKHGRNKKIRFLVHFNANYEEFNQLATNGHMFLISPNVSCQPFISHVPHQSPLHGTS